MDEPSAVEKFRDRLENAQKYSDVWEIVKDTVSFTLDKYRRSMMLFLDDLPIRLGAYHPMGTNNIVLNRRLVEVVEASIESKRVVNALVLNLLIHEYLHALGQFSEHKVRQLVYEIAEKCFGTDYIVTVIAKRSPWVLLEKIPLVVTDAPKRIIEIVKDFEKADGYIV